KSAVAPPSDDTYTSAPLNPAATKSQQTSFFDGLRFPSQPGLPISGRFEVPFWARLFTDGRFQGTTKYQATDGKRLIIVLKARAKIAGASESRDVVLTLRPDSADPNQLRFAGRMVKEVDPATIAALGAIPSVDGQIDALLSRVTENERVRGVPKNP